MDVSRVGSPPKVNSVHRDEDHPLDSSDSGRKRKLQSEQLFLPASKRKFPGGCVDSGLGSPATHRSVPDESSEEESWDEATADPEIDEGPDQIEGPSSKDTTSRTASEAFVPRYERSASFGTPEEIAFEDSIYSLDSSVPHSHEAGRVFAPGHAADSQDETRLETGCNEYSQGRLPEHGADDDEYMEEEYPDDAIEEMQLSCNTVGQNVLGLPSASWSIKQDALPGTIEPTIDQEFEQYFSMFMV